MKYQIITTFIISLCCNISLTQAQEKNLEPVLDSTALPQVLLKGTSIKSELTHTPAAVNRLDHRELNRNSPTLLTSSFNRIPGVYTQAGALNTNRITIRGIGARAQYGTTRLKAYFNEIPISTGDGQTVINDIDLEAIESVEIIKGPNSSLYGSGLGGVLHLFAYQPRNERSFAKISSSFGSYQLLKNTASVGYSDKKKSLFATYNHLQNEGYRENSEYDRKSFNFNGTFYSGENSAISFLGNFTRLKAYIPSSIGKTAYRENPESAAFKWISAEGYESYDRFLLGISYRQHFTDNLENTTSVFINSRDAYEPRPFDILKENSFSMGARTRFNYKTELFSLPAEASLGAEFLNENYYGSNFENLYEEFPNQGSVRGSQIANLEQDRKYYNLFAQLNLQVFPKLKLVGGLNVNFTDYALTDLFEEDEIDQTGDYQFETIWSPRIAALYELNSTKNIYLNISKGFSTPTVDETLTPQGLINTSLKPEIGWDYEVGFKGNWFEDFYTEIALYSIQVNDLLVAERIAEDQYVGANAGKTDHNGVELLLKYNWKITSAIILKPYASANFNFYKFDEFIDEGQDFSGNDLTGVPDQKINIGLDLIAENGFSLFSNVLFVSEIPLNDENSLETDRYQLINIKAGYDFTIFNDFQINLNAGVNNVFDEHYAVSTLPNAVGFGNSEPRYYYPGNDRNFYGGVEVKYLF
ncbi:TonB-dependent receptor family protein [Mesonia aestuariivivens]|uniref:TonB-dependent receptor n=1 Tax=Mesonia aestuariivivens TaxID=2796128 RepID=A0ABS6W1V0_9FLAO|nr:TonB-dependent receptor [Mesonia aestuariivivens]MBW2961729.1 TonB-dependent receptor [Mesonia aestuariivivens]